MLSRPKEPSEIISLVRDVPSIRGEGPWVIIGREFHHDWDLMNWRPNQIIRKLRGLLVERPLEKLLWKVSLIWGLFGWAKSQGMRLISSWQRDVFWKGLGIHWLLCDLSRNALELLIDLSWIIALLGRDSCFICTLLLGLRRSNRSLKSFWCLLRVWLLLSMISRIFIGWWIGSWKVICSEFWIRGIKTWGI